MRNELQKSSLLFLVSRLLENQALILSRELRAFARIFLGAENAGFLFQGSLS